MTDKAHAAPAAPAASDKAALRRRLIAERRALADRDVRAARLAEALAAWLGARPERVVGAYWPIRGEFDPLPVLGAWMAAAPDRRVGLPVIDGATQTLRFHEWWPGCPMAPDAFGIPAPSGTAPATPGLLLVPCVGFSPAGLRLGYGGGFYDRTLAVLRPRPATLGLAFAHARLPDLAGEAHDIALDAVLTEDGLA